MSPRQVRGPGLTQFPIPPAGVQVVSRLFSPLFSVVIIVIVFRRLGVVPAFQFGLGIPRVERATRSRLVVRPRPSQGSRFPVLVLFILLLSSVSVVKLTIYVLSPFHKDSLRTKRYTLHDHILL